MLAKRRGARLIGLAAAIAAVSLALGGCTPGKAQPTPIVVVVTPSPTAHRTATPAPTATPTEAPVETPTAVPTPTAPVAYAMPSSVCTGTADNKAFWGDVANKMSWDVYCPVLPSGWFVKTGNYETSVGGKVTMTYRGPGTATVEVNEGNFCAGSADTCAPSATSVGPVFLADMSGTLVTLPGGGFAIYVAPGTSKAYQLSGTGITQETLIAFATALTKVAKS